MNDYHYVMTELARVREENDRLRSRIKEFLNGDTTVRELRDSLKPSWERDQDAV